MTARPRIVLDCDPGNDDVFAIGLAAFVCDVSAITTVAGNAPLEHTSRNALIAAELFGLGNVPIHAGASGPLSAASAFAPDAHGETGLDGPKQRNPVATLSGHDAVSYLVDATRDEEGLWLVVTGPLTNVALAVQADPTLPGRVAGLSWMGGSATFGNVTPTAEFNAHFDPESVDVVVGRPWRELRMFGLNVTHQVLAGSDMEDRLRSVGSMFCADLLAFSNRFQARQWGIEPRQATSPMHDPCAVLGVARPDLFRFERRWVDVALSGPCRGATVVDERPWRHRDGVPTNVSVAYGVDAEAARALLESALARAVA